jgi:hypothetical protein
VPSIESRNQKDDEVSNNSELREEKENGALEVLKRFTKYVKFQKSFFTRLETRRRHAISR